MFNFFLGLVIGAIIMDLLWAFKFGIPQVLYVQTKFFIKKFIKNLCVRRKIG